MRSWQFMHTATCMVYGRLNFNSVNEIPRPGKIAGFGILLFHNIFLLAIYFTYATSHDNYVKVFRRKVASQVIWTGINCTCFHVYTCGNDNFIYAAIRSANASSVGLFFTKSKSDQIRSFSFCIP